MIRPVSRLAPDTRPSPPPVRPELPAPRQQAAYRCTRGHDFTLTFAAEAEPPQTWDYCRCGAQAHPVTSGACFPPAVYRCTRGHDFMLTFAAEAEPPQTWDYCRCGAQAHPVTSGACFPPVSGGASSGLPAVLARRAPAVREQVLADRVAEVAAMRRTGQSRPADFAFTENKSQKR